MKAITARRDWWNLSSRTAKYLIERMLQYFKIPEPAPVNGIVNSAITSPAVKTGPAVNATPKPIDQGDFYSSQFFVLYGIQPSWDSQRIMDGLRDLKLSFGPFSKVIICSESYVDELVHRCEDFNYDAYLLTCDGRDELKNAVRVVKAGKWYLSRSVITSYCVARRREWAH